ncbi:MAG: hypothetical protein ACKVUS_05385 [Saprospiraceae bacterium]
MGAQQIRHHINELVCDIQDEAFLNACYEAVAGISKAYRQVVKQTNREDLQGKPTRRRRKSASKPLNGAQTDVVAETSLPHDLSFVVLANEVFKGSEPAPPEASTAFRKALLKSASKRRATTNSL